MSNLCPDENIFLVTGMVNGKRTEKRWLTPQSFSTDTTNAQLKEFRQREDAAKKQAEQDHLQDKGDSLPREEAAIALAEENRQQILADMEALLIQKAVLH